MLTREQAGDIFDRIKKLVTADEVEVLFWAGDSALTRFANNTIHQNVAEENHVVSVRTAFGGRTARASTNKFDDESLRRVVDASESLAKVQHPDPDLLPMPDAREADDAGEGARATPSRHFAATAAITPELRADGVKNIVDVADRHKLTTAGTFSSNESVEGIFNSRGLSKWHDANFGRNFHHHARRRFFRLAESEFARRANLDPLALAEIAAQGRPSIRRIRRNFRQANTR